MPRNYFSTLIRLFLFWLLFFAFGRILFLAYHFQKLDAIPFSDIALGFYHALRLDFSAASYLIALPWIFASIQLFVPKKIFSTLIHSISLFFIGLASLITISELEIYRQWGTKLSAKVLQYLGQPSEIFGSLDNTSLIVLLVLLFSTLFLGISFYLKIAREKETPLSTNIYGSITAILFTGFMIVFFIRGGLQQIPIIQSDAYYSRKDVLNSAAVNPSWNLLQSIDQNRKMLNHNPFVRMKDEEAQNIVDSLNASSASESISLLTNTRPNVVLIILEGVSADMMSTLGGFDQTAPFLDSLSRNGFLFSEFYSTGDRSEQGMAAILSGFPAQPITSILRQPSKFKKLPSLIRSLGNQGYETNFFFGGQLSYGNIRAYLLSNGINKIVELIDLLPSKSEGKLGVHDGPLFQRHLEESKTFVEPFFSTLFTMSTHTPYDFPGKHKKYEWAKEENGYVNGMMYTDSCIRAYMNVAKTMPWFKNTLFVFVSDHSHSTPKENNFFSRAHRKIPFFLFGDVLKEEFKGRRDSLTASQIDIPATLLAQLGMDFTSYNWSKNLMHPETQRFAFCAFHNGSSGWIEGENNFARNPERTEFYIMNVKDSLKRNELLKKEEAYLQIVFRDYLKY